MALDQARREIVRVGSLAHDMIRQSVHIVTSGDERDAERLTRIDDDIDALYGEVIQFLGQLSQKSLVADQPRKLSQFVGTANYLENIGDVIKKELLAVLRKRISNEVTISPSTLARLQPIADEVRRAFGKALAALETDSPEDALDAIESKDTINGLAEEATAHILKRLVSDEPRRLVTFQIETDIIEIYRRINTYTRRIARLTLEKRGEEDGNVAPTGDHAA